MDEKIPLSQGPETCGENRNAGPFHSPSTARFDIFLKEEAEYIITLIFFKERKKEECGEVRTREMLGGRVPFGTDERHGWGETCQCSMWKHACARVEGDHTEEGPLHAN